MLPVLLIHRIRGKVFINKIQIERQPCRELSKAFSTTIFIFSLNYARQSKALDSSRIPVIVQLVLRWESNFFQQEIGFHFSSKFHRSAYDM